MATYLQMPPAGGGETEMSENFFITAKGKDLECTSLASGYLLLGGIKCSKSSCGRGCCGFTYFYPEPAELRQRIADLKGPLTPVIAELRVRLEALEAPPADIPAELGQRLKALAVELAPAIADLRERIAVLQASLAPIVAEVRAYAEWPASLDDMEYFAGCYEKAFASKTEWEPVYREEDDVVDDYVDEETDSALSPGADDPSGSEDGDSIGRTVELGDPLLMEPKIIPDGMHREPYIVVS